MPPKPRRRGESGSLSSLQRRLWLIVELCTEAIEDADQDLEVRFRAGHLMT
jgi:hypothetical protein